MTGAHRGRECDHTSLILKFLKHLVNTCLLTRVCPPRLKHGIIVMIPKPGKVSDDAKNMRPITLLPELGKLTARILANRITLILHNNPKLLHPAQRAYLRDGSSRQCLTALTNICEDFWESNSTSNLIITSYDVRKAFDSVQRFSIAAACDRIGMPHNFREYIIETLDQATSQVRCRHGLTDDIDVMTSVRQGDPLAAIVFIIIMDGLHVGLEHNPLGSQAGQQYTMANGTTVASLGYADDTALTSETFLGTLVQREFFVAHHLRFNSDKSYCSRPREATSAWNQ